MDTFDKLESLTSTLINNLDSSYLQQSVELVALTATTSEISAHSSLTVNTPSFTTTSPIVSTTIQSPKPVINQPSSSSSSSPPLVSIPSSSTTTLSPSQTRIIAMANQYAPLVLPAQLHTMPVDYQSNIFLFDATGHYTAQQNVNRMSDIFELHEID